MWAPGTLVVCVDGTPHGGEPPPHAITGQVYTVERHYPVWIEGYGEEWTVELVELPQPGNEDWYPGFQAAFFRPVAPLPKSITRFLTAPKQTEATS